ncbi:hypothetical protein AB0I39_16900 [Kitasatospora purpeofusca]|uniref:hypothetical protein n=1 Tax=Kitasatospora purpeofusca TaxID=67352 RepID=UPI0033F0048B
MTTPFAQPAAEPSEPPLSNGPKPYLYALVDGVGVLGRSQPEVLQRIRESLPDPDRPAFDQMVNVKALTEEARDSVAVRDMARYFRNSEAAKALFAAEKAGPPSWGRIDPLAALEAARDPKVPEVGRFNARSSEPAHGVFYRGCVNDVHGESESGKSWLLFHVVVQELKSGHVVVYVDYEDDAGAVYRRLKLLGATDEMLLGDHFRYHRPNGPMTEAEREAFAQSTASGGSLVVFDGVTEGMALEGLDGRLEKDVATWHAMTTKDLAHTGWCVVVIDHTPHGQKRALGSQHKKSVISGVSYLVEPAEPIGVGRRGRLRIKVEKDRPGAIRAEAASGTRPQWRGDLVVDFTTTPPAVALWGAAPGIASEDQGFEARPPRPLLEAVMGFVAANPGCGTREIRSGVKRGSTDDRTRALRWLVDQRCIGAERAGRSVSHSVLTELPEPTSGDCVTTVFPDLERGSGG